MGNEVIGDQMNSKIMFYLSVFVVAAAGSYVGNRIKIDSMPSASASTADNIVAKKLDIVNNSGKKIITMGTSGEGAPAIWFFDKNGKARLNLGVYADGNSMVVLNDENELAVGILRSVGPSLPVLVMKNGGRDRLIQGLSGPNKNPFLVNFDEKNQKKMIFGEYAGF